MLSSRSNVVISMLNCIFFAFFICFLASLLTCVEMSKFDQESMQNVLLRFRSVQFFRLRGIRRNVLPKFIELCFETPAVLVSLWGTQIWRPKTNRNIGIKRVLISRQLINIKLNTYSKNKDCSDKKNLKKRCHSFNYSCVTDFAAPLLSRHAIFNNYSPKAKLILLNNPRNEVEGIIQQY